MTSSLDVARAPHISAVCFDIDDTLIDFTGNARTALESVIGRTDLWSFWEQLTERHVARVISGEISYDTMRRDRLRDLFVDLGLLLDDELLDGIERRRMDRMWANWRLFDDALPCLEWLHAAGLKVAAVTNASGAHQRIKIAEAGLEPFFDAVVIAGELGVAKPDPAIFHAACAVLGVPVERTLHIGDRLDVDAHGARDAGLHGVWLSRIADADLGWADVGVPVVRTLADLPELLVSDFVTTGMPVQRCR